MEPTTPASPSFDKLSFESLNTRIAALHETTKNISTLIDRLQNLDFRPGSVPLPADLDDPDEDGTVIAELNQEIKDSLRDETETLELLDQEVREFPGGKAGSHSQLLKEGLEQMISRAYRDIAESVFPLYILLSSKLIFYSDLTMYFVLLLLQLGKT